MCRRGVGRWLPVLSLSWGFSFRDNRDRVGRPLLALRAQCCVCLAGATGSVLRHAEPVAGVVLEEGLDAVGALLGRRQELDAAGLELLVGLAAIVGVEDAAAEHA